MPVELLVILASVLIALATGLRPTRRQRAAARAEWQR
jgi:hypothetical protein